MAHDIYNNSAMAYAGDVPWHGLGTKLPKNATWEEIKAVLPFYDALERPVFAAGIPAALPDRKALIASNDGRYLATVGVDYGVVQFDQLAQAVIAAAGDNAVFHTAGLMGERGARAWLLGELPNPISVKGDDSQIRKFILATSSHDGSSAVDWMNCATRVVCRNTLGVALGEKSGFHVHIRHTKNAAKRLEDAVTAFKVVAEGMDRFGELANALAGRAISAQQSATVVEELFPLKADVERDSLTWRRIEAKRDRVLQMAESGQGIGPAMRGTAWALFQGITEYADHERPMRGFKDVAPTDSDRFQNAAFGPAVVLKQAGLAAIRSAVGV